VLVNKRRGSRGFGPTADLDPAGFDELFARQCFDPLTSWSARSLPAWHRGDTEAIVSLDSMAGHVGLETGGAPRYGATKAALTALSRLVGGRVQSGGVARQHPSRPGPVYTDGASTDRIDQLRQRRR